jgi:hypothetical protein
MGLSPSLEANSYSRMSQNFMEREGTYHFQMSPALVPTLNQKTPVHDFPLNSLTYILILSCHHVFQVVYFLRVFLPKHYMHSSPIRAICPAYPILIILVFQLIIGEE